MAQSIRLWPRSRFFGILLHLCLGLPLLAVAGVALAASDLALSLRLGLAGLFVVAAAVVSVRQQIHYCPERGTIEQVWSLFVPLRRKVHPIGGYTGVVVEREGACCVRLCGPGGELEIDRFAARRRAFEEANRVGTLLGWASAVELTPAPRGGRFTIALGAALTAAGIGLLGLMIGLSDWTRWIPLPFLVAFLFWGLSLMWLGLFGPEGIRRRRS